MQQKEKKTRLPIAPLAPMRLEVDRVGGRLSALVSGVSAISEFSDTRAVLESAAYRVEISGKGLSVGVYEGNSVEIIGGIENVGFTVAD